jgi:ADP-ribose pyrophosphatase YjhB (NUDIX family)
LYKHAAFFILSKGILSMDREYAGHPMVGVGGIVLNEGKVLLVRRGQQPGYGKWSIPGGMVELGESLTEAIRREVLEECGIEIELADVIAVLERVIRREDERVRYHYILIDFLGYWKGGELQPASDILEARWADPSEMENLEMTDRTKQVVFEAMGLSEKEGVYYGGGSS